MERSSIPPLVADESVDFSIVAYLRQNSIDVFTILENSPSVSDNEVLRIAFERKALLITEDKDFGELTFRLQKPHRGIFLLRFLGVDTDTKCKLTYEALVANGYEMIDAFAVLTENKLRIRKKQ